MRDHSDNSVNLDDTIIVKICNSPFGPAKDLSTSTREALREHGEIFITNKVEVLQESLRRWIKSSLVNFRLENYGTIHRQTGFQNLIDIIEATCEETNYDESIEAYPSLAKDISKFSPRGILTTFTSPDMDLSSIMFDLTVIASLSFLLSPMYYYPSLPTDIRTMHNLPKGLNEHSWMLSRREMIYAYAAQIGNELIDYLQPLLGEMRYDFVIDFVGPEASDGATCCDKASKMFDTESHTDSDAIKQTTQSDASPLSMDDLKNDIAYLLDFSADTDFMLSSDAITPNKKRMLAMNNDCAEHLTIVDNLQTHIDSSLQDDQLATPIKSQHPSPILQLNLPRRKTPSPPLSPHLDSKGMDLNFLSQLPYSMRSEARLVFALNEPKSRPRGSRFMVDWLASNKQDNSVMVGHLSSSTISPAVLAELPDDIRRSIESEMKSQGKSMRKKHQPKRKRGLHSFFSSAKTKR